MEELRDNRMYSDYRYEQINQTADYFRICQYCGRTRAASRMFDEQFCSAVCAEKDNEEYGNGGW